MSEDQEKNLSSPPIRPNRLPFQSVNSPTKNEKKRKHTNDQGDNKSDSKRRKSGLEFLDQFLKGKIQTPSAKSYVKEKSENKELSSSSDIEISDQDNDFVNDADVSILSEEPSFISRTDSNNDVQEISSTSTDTPGRDKSDIKMKKRKTKLTESERKERERQMQLRLQEKTEKQRKKQEQKEKKEIEKQKLREMKMEEKKQKLKEKEEKEIEKRQKKEEKEIERKQKKEEKEEEKRQKKEAKERARLQKEEQTKQKQEEKRLIEEEKKKLENEKMKRQQKCQAAFRGFFVFKGEKPEQSTCKFNKDERFLPFQLGKKQKLAPIHRTSLSSLEGRLSELDDVMPNQDSSNDYLNSLKSLTYKKGKSEPTWRSKDNDVVLVSDEKSALPWRKAKLFQFHENNRPAYYGTFKKKSNSISARRPFAKDENLDYTVDSDEEWEEEEPGESISHSEGEDEEEKGEDGDEDEDDGFFVPHGYLSEDEGCDDDDSDEKLNPEKLKARQIALARKFEEEIKEQPKALKPLIMGCCWGSDEDKAQGKFLKILKQYKAEIIVETPILLCNPQSAPSLHDVSDCGDSARKGAQPKPIPKEAMPHLIRFLHGNWNNRDLIIREFKQFWSKKSQELGNESGAGSIISKRQLEMRIKSIASYDKRTDYKIRCWYVKENVISEYAVTDLQIPNPYAKEMEMNNMKEGRRNDDAKKS